MLALQRYSENVVACECNNIFCFSTNTEIVAGAFENGDYNE